MKRPTPVDSLYIWDSSRAKKIAACHSLGGVSHLPWQVKKRMSRLLPLIWYWVICWLSPLPILENFAVVLISTYMVATGLAASIGVNIDRGRRLRFSKISWFICYIFLFATIIIWRNFDDTDTTGLWHFSLHILSRLPYPLRHSQLASIQLAPRRYALFW